MNDDARAFRRLREIIRARFLVTDAELMGRRRTPVLDRVRQLTYALAYDLMRGVPVMKIGAEFGRTHVAVVLARRAVVRSEDLTKAFITLKREIEHDDAFAPYR